MNIPAINTKANTALKTLEGYKTNKSLFDGYRSDVTLSVNTSVNYIYPSTSGTARTAIVPIEFGKDYSIEVNGEHNRLLIGIANGSQANAPLVRINNRQTLQYYDTFQFTNDNNYAYNKYLVITVSSQSHTPDLRIHEGKKVPSHPTGFEIDNYNVLLEKGKGDISSYEMRRNSQIFTVDSIPSGTPTTHSEVLGLYDTLIGDNPSFISKQTLGQDAQSNDIVEYQFKIPIIENDMGYQRKKIGITTGTHGDEKNPVFGAFHFMKHLTENPLNMEIIARLKSVFDFYVIPVVNPSGYNLDTRENHNSVDLNRDYIDLTQAESNIVADWLDSNQFDYFIDFHNTWPTTDPKTFTWLSVTENGEGEDELKRAYMKAISELSMVWPVRFPRFDKNVIFGNIPNRPASTTTRDYANNAGLKGCTLEVPWFVPYGSGEDDSVEANTISVETLGNFIVQIYKNNA